MIFYFSATGNTKWIAETIAKGLNDTAVDMQSSDPAAYTFTDTDVIGIVSPVYYCIVPDIVLNFAKRIQTNGAWTFAVVDYSNYTGHALQYLDQNGMHIHSGYGVKMPDNTSVFGLTLDNEETSLQKLKRAVPRVNEIINRLQEKEEGVFDSEEGEKDPQEQTDTLGALYHSGNVTKTDVWSVDTEKCIGCGLCARRCPAQAIEIQDHHPVWIRETCAMCAACINNCPVLAIEYGDKSQGVYRYTYQKFSRMLNQQ